MENFLYHYRAIVKKVVDGDTVYCDVDLGFNFNNKLMIFRLAEINTPELKGNMREAGLKSKDFVIDKVLGKEIVLETFKDVKEKYGRYLAKVYYKENDQWVCLNDLLVQTGLAEKYQH